MRTTLSVEDDVRIAARAMATQQQRSIGEVIFRAGKSVHGAGKSVHGAGRAAAASVKKFLSCRVVGRTPVTLEIVSALRDERP